MVWVFSPHFTNYIALYLEELEHFLFAPEERMFEHSLGARSHIGVKLDHSLDQLPACKVFCRQRVQNLVEISVHSDEVDTVQTKPSKLSWNFFLKYMNDEIKYEPE